MCCLHIFVARKEVHRSCSKFDGTCIQQEFMVMKRAMHKVKRHDAVLFPKMIVLANVMFLISVQTAIVEHGFSGTA
eukprot:scaffold120450_cov22-Tisochrysis_lutea.AAC.1